MQAYYQKSSTQKTSCMVPDSVRSASGRAIVTSWASVRVFFYFCIYFGLLFIHGLWNLMEAPNWCWVKPFLWLWVCGEEPEWPRWAVSLQPALSTVSQTFFPYCKKSCVSPLCWGSEMKSGVSCTSARCSCMGKGFWVRTQQDACAFQLELSVCCSTCNVPTVTLL